MNDNEWAQYARLQRMLRKSSNAIPATAIEAAMDTVLESIANGETLTDKQVDTLIANRGHRERKRKVIEATLPIGEEEVGGEDVIASSLFLERLRRECTSDEYMLLIRVGAGFTYRELAITYSAPAGTVKARVHRLRARWSALAP